jgi:hypothetical protein
MRGELEARAIERAAGVPLREPLQSFRHGEAPRAAAEPHGI